MIIISEDFNFPQAANGYPITDLLLDKIFALVNEDMDNYLNLNGEYRIFRIITHKGQFFGWIGFCSSSCKPLLAMLSTLNILGKTQVYWKLSFCFFGHILFLTKLFEQIFADYVIILIFSEYLEVMKLTGSFEETMKATVIASQQNETII